MAIDFNTVRKLQDANITPGQRWVYVADFNIDHDLKSTARVDTEVSDLQRIVNAGGVTLILAHKGRFGKGNDSLDFIVPHLEKKLEGANVVYFPQNCTDEAIAYSKTLVPGTVAIMGNTRFEQGEETNDSYIARKFAQLGDCVAVGGFGKAHRMHASNVGILDYLPGYITQSQLLEMELLNPWCGKNEEQYSVVILGGVKKDKITTGLKGFSQMYDAIIPGGIVLNTLLASQGFNVGDSLVSEGSKSYVTEAGLIFEKSNAEICLPSQVVIAEKEGLKNPQTIYISDGVPKGYMIVDYLFDTTMHDVMNEAVSNKGRILLAGTPGIYQAGFSKATNDVMSYMRNSNIQGAVLGGDTAREVNYKEGIVSTGGGSALYFAAHGTTPVFRALQENMKKL